MLVLTHVPGKFIQIGEAKVMIRRKGNRVRVYIEAPKTVRVLREGCEPREEATSQILPTPQEEAA